MVVADPNMSVVVETFATEEVIVPDDYVQVDVSEGLVDGGPSYFFNKNLARDPKAMAVGTISYDANDAMIAFAVEWPDGTPGNYTALVVSATFPGSVDSYQVTYGSPVTRTYTQPTITRDASGKITNQPAITET